MEEIWTIGHSNKSFQDFLELLKEYRIEILADVRSFPGSRKFPWFNREYLAENLPKEGIEYNLIKNLGGRRKVNPDSHNTAWENIQFRGYADYMETPDFIEGINELTSYAKRKRTSYMCSEVLWWRCHRSMISDYLKLNGWKVIHIMGKNKTEKHPYTKPAKIINERLDYS
ncbi:MAG: DUF488 domain-containing protein [Ignavibacteriaceae bacterium]|nr:DUF488 domain-containing protein [Ignavibacteriaceae bacterium]